MRTNEGASILHFGLSGHHTIIFGEVVLPPPVFGLKEGGVRHKKSGHNTEVRHTILLDEKGFDIDLIKTVADVVNFPPHGKDPNGIAQTDQVTFASIKKCFVTGDNFDISEGQIAGRDGTFEYLDPIVGQI